LVSYTGGDIAWAEWAAYVLEDAGFTTLVQAWDFRPGSNSVIPMQDALGRSDRVTALLSERYLVSAFATAEWAAAFGGKRRLSRWPPPSTVGLCDAPDGTRLVDGGPALPARNPGRDAAIAAALGQLIARPPATVAQLRPTSEGGV